MIASNCNQDREDGWNIIENDEYLSQFITIDSDKTSELSSSFINSTTLSATEQLSKLTKGINILENELHYLISNNHKSLMSQGTCMKKLENTLLNLKAKTKALLSSVDEIRRKLVEPYEDVQQNWIVLNRLHETTNLLRCIQQKQQLARSIPNLDMVQISKMMKEVDEFCGDVDLSGIDVIEEDIKNIENERQNILKKARSNLNEALNNENLNQANLSIQVFINLNKLESELEKLKSVAQEAVMKKTKLVLDISSLSKSEQDKSRPKSAGPGRVTGGTFPGMNVSAFRSKLWSKWSDLLKKDIYTRCVHMYILEVVVKQLSQSSINSDNEHGFENIDIISDFWKQVREIMSTQLISSSKASPYIKEALEIEYPRLLRLHTELSKDLQKLLKKHPQDVFTENNNLFQNDDLYSSTFQQAYLFRSLQRLTTFVDSLFTNECLPNLSDIEKLTKMLQNELTLSFINETLCKAIVKNIGKAIRSFCINCEKLVKNDENSAQVIGAANANQKLNINIANTALRVKKETEEIFSKTRSKLSESCMTEIKKEFVLADEMINGIIQPIIDSISKFSESIILTMHKESYNLESYQEPVQCSLYMKELNRFIARTSNEFLKPFDHQELLRKHCLDLATRCVDLFIRHVCLVRHLSMGGRRKIEEDFKKLENVISPLCREIHDLGGTFKILRALRPLFGILSAQQVANHEFVGTILPYSLVLMHMYSFAPPEMMSPHESCDWSVERLSQWLDKNKSEHKRLELVSGALQRYQRDVSDKKKTTFHEVYPVMMNLLEKGFSAVNVK